MDINSIEKEALAGVLSVYLQNEPEVLCDAFNYEMSEQEIRLRVSQYNTLAYFVNSELDGVMETKYEPFTTEDLNDLIDGALPGRYR